MAGDTDPTLRGRLAVAEATYAELCMLKLRRLPTDPQQLLTRLDKLEEFAAADKMEPFMAVTIAETLRRRNNWEDNAPPPSLDEWKALFLNEAMLDVMREQADGPWRIYATQAQGMELVSRMAGALAQLDTADEPSPPAPTVPGKGSATTAESPHTGGLLFPEHKWDVAISYAGEDRGVVEPIVKRLQIEGLRVFHADMDEIRSYLWGKDLVTELPRIYREEAAYCIVFVSEAYARSMWTRLELRNALSRALENEEYIKPIRLDDAKLDRLSPTVSYLDARPGRLYSDPTKLVPVMLRAIRNRGRFVPEELRLDPSSRGITVRHYFRSILPGVLRWQPERMMSLDATVLYSVTGTEAGVWLLRLAPPEPIVQEITPEDDMIALALPRHLVIKATTSEMTNMLIGQFDARKALIEGNVELSGDLTLLKPFGVLFQSQFASPPQS
jgi:hypothetical protein